MTQGAFGAGIIDSAVYSALRKYILFSLFNFVMLQPETTIVEIHFFKFLSTLSTP